MPASGGLEAPRQRGAPATNDDRDLHNRPALDASSGSGATRAAGCAQESSALDAAAPPRGADKNHCSNVKIYDSNQSATTEAVNFQQATESTGGGDGGAQSRCKTTTEKTTRLISADVDGNADANADADDSSSIDRLHRQARATSVGAIEPGERQRAGDKQSRVHAQQGIAELGARAFKASEQVAAPAQSLEQSGLHVAHSSTFLQSAEANRVAGLPTVVTRSKTLGSEQEQEQELERLESITNCGSRKREKVVVANKRMTQKMLKKSNRVGYEQARVCCATPDELASDERAPPLAIECKQLRYQVTEINFNDIFNYKRREILHSINLSVPEACIYGLLGPSGCGKTTMLKCVAGRLKPSGGSVRVFGRRPGEPGSQIPGPAIGYMPQELSIYDEFTINETLTYFGMICRMKSKLLCNRIEFLIKFLDLPNKSRLLRTLSGGQKRRVSLAAALVHSPPLLILDEPTVGVDPLLREVIWNHLVQLAKLDRITIVITTHYIEEARQANIVGLMRNGNLLAEDVPKRLMLKYNLPSLESVFLSLCMEDKLAERKKIKQLKQKNNQEKKKDEQTKKLVKKSMFTYDSKPETGIIDHVSLKENVNKNNNNTHEGPKITPIDVAQSSVTPAATSEASSILGELNNFNYSLKNDNDDEHSSEGDATLATCRPSSVISADQVTLMIDEEDGVSRDIGQHSLEEEINQKNSEKRSRDFIQEEAKTLIINQTKHLGQSVGSMKNLRNFSTKLQPIQSNMATIWLEMFWALVWKNFLRLRRNPPVMLFEFILPAFQVLLFCLCIGGDPFDVPLAIVNEESVPQASRLFLNAIDKRTFRNIYYDNLSEALDSVREGNTWAVVHIPERFTKNLQDRLFHPVDADNVTLKNGTITIYPDLTNLHLALSMENTFREAFVKFTRDTLDLFGYDTGLADLPIKVGAPIYGGYGTKPSYLEFMAPGVIVSITYVMATGLTALAFILEKRDGLLERSQISGVTTSQILLAHVSLQVIVMVFQIGFVLLVTFYIFEIPSHGPFYLVVLLILLQGCAGMGFGLIISAVCNEENTAVMMLVGTFYINLILAGIIWPIEAMPKWLRLFSYAQPQTLPVESLRNILSRGWGIDKPPVYWGFIVTIGWLVVFLLGAGACMKYFK